MVWCLLLVGPYGMSAPIKNDAYWVDPCGGHPVGDGAGADRRSDAELLDAIMMPATRALNKAKTYAESFVNAISIKVDVSIFSPKFLPPLKRLQRGEIFFSLFFHLLLTQEMGGGEKIGEGFVLARISS